MLFDTVTKMIYVALLAFGKSNSVSANGVIWSSTGGGWRAMAASSAYSQVFAHLGLLDRPSNPITATMPKIDTVTTTSGSSWWATQFFFNSQYYSAIVDGTPSSLGVFTQKWFEAYASTQEGITTDAGSCGPLEELCSILPQDGSDLSHLRNVITVAKSFDFSWPNLLYAMFEATSKTFDDSANMVNVRASHEEKIPVLDNVDLCFHTSLLPNARAKESNTITYLTQEWDNINSSYTVPLPYDWCIGDQNSEWRTSLPEGNMLPAPDQFVNYTAQSEFPMFPPQQSDGIFTTPQSGNVAAYPVDMAMPFGGIPTAVQISAASSSAVANLSPDVPSFFAQYTSLLQFGIKSLKKFSDDEKLELVQGLDKIQADLWDTDLLGNAAVSSAWTDPNPKGMPEGQEDTFWFADGGFTDGPSVAGAIARYQQKYGSAEDIKLILSNNNNVDDNMNNILGYFSTTWNQGSEPGSFIWPMGTGNGPQANPQQSKQIFQEYMDEKSLNSTLEYINGTTITLTTISATTVNNDAFGVVGGQMVSIILVNLNSDIPTLLLTKPVIDRFTPALVDMVESIASSKHFADRIHSFVSGAPHNMTSESPTSSKSQKATSGGFLRGNYIDLSTN